MVGRGEGRNGRGYVCIAGGIAIWIVDDRVGGNSVRRHEGAVGSEERGRARG